MFNSITNLTAQQIGEKLQLKINVISTKSPNYEQHFSGTKSAASCRQRQIQGSSTWCDVALVRFLSPLCAAGEFGSQPCSL